MVRKKQTLSTPEYIRRRSNQQFWKTMRRLTASWRVLPDFAIIGVQKGGTTSFYNYLAQHPNVKSSFKKEIKFFGCNFDNGLGWYRSFFPTENQMASGQITGEASPYYIFHPKAAARMAATIPQAKAILLLRNPVERAYSHYQHSVRTGRETLNFEGAIDAEAERLAGEEERILADSSHPLFKHMHFSYLSKGIYLDQIKRWHQHFPRKQLLILCSETMFADPAAALRLVESFLGIPHHDFSGLKPFNTGAYSDMVPETRKRLETYFQPYNEQLSKYLGAEYTWA